MTSKWALGGGFGCFTWLGLWLLTFIVILALGIYPDTDLGMNTIVLFGLVTLILAVPVNLRLERRWAEEKAEADRKAHEEHARRMELERKFYAENPERLVTEACRFCDMMIPAFARVCPYCTRDLRRAR